MVEEMYLEEIKDQEQNGESQDMNRNNNKNEHNKMQHGGGGGDHQNHNNAEAANFKLMNDPQSKTENFINNHSLTDHHMSNNNSSSSSMLGSFSLIRPSSSDILGSPKKPRTNNNNNLDFESAPSTKTMLLRDQINDTKHLLHTSSGHAPGFGAYPIAEIGSRFNPEMLTPRFHGNGVSLTLGLPHSHSDNLSLSATQHNYLSNPNLRPVELGNSVGADFTDIPPPPPSTAYDGVEMQTTKRFAAQLLPDFVA